MKNLILLITVILMCCASPYKVAKLEPMESRTYWNWGRQYAVLATDEKEVRMAFETNSRTQLVFNIEIENLGKDTLLVAPEYFYINYFNFENNSVPFSSKSVVDPESMITQLEKDLAQQDANEANAAAGQLLEITLETASDIASIGKEQTQEEYEAEQFERDRSRAYRAQENYELRMNQMSLDERRRFYDESLLRKTSLPPNSYLSGQSYFWFDKNASRYRIFIPLGGDTLSFDFKQRIIP